MLWNLCTYLFRKIGRQAILSPVRSPPLSVWNCDCIWPLTHIQKWIQSPPSILRIPSPLSLTHTYTYSDTYKEKRLEKEKIKTAPIWSIHHLPSSICHCKMGQNAHSCINFSLFVLILLLTLGWSRSGCAKGRSIISLFSDSQEAVSSQEPSRDALLWLHGELWTLCGSCLTGEKFRICQPLPVLSSGPQVAKANVFCQIAKELIREERLMDLLIQHAHLI